ncbi:MAG: FliG C-terminal domain-containing protein [Pseudomonadota bacterium]
MNDIAVIDGASPPVNYDDDPVVGSLTTAQKAAVLLAAMGPEVAGPIVERIGDKHLRAFARAFSQLRAIPRSSVDTIVEEFLKDVDRPKDEVRGGFKETRQLLSNFVTSETLARILDDIDAPGGKSIWEKLDEANEHDLSEYLKSQHPQVVAVVLSRLGAEMSARLLDSFDEQFTQSILLRMARLSTVDQRFINTIAKTVTKEFIKPMRRRALSRRPSDVLSTVINFLPQEKRVNVLEFIEGEEPALADEVKKSLLTFQDLWQRLPPSAISAIVRVADRSQLLQAIKFGKQNAAKTIEYFFENLSKRMGQQLEEDIAKMTSVKMKDAEAAQNAIIDVIRKLVESGEVELIDLETDDTDEYL